MLWTRARNLVKGYRFWLEGVGGAKDVKSSTGRISLKRACEVTQVIEAEFSLSNGAMNATFNTVEGLQVGDLSGRRLRVM